jgi:hypothetical protein
MTDDEDIGDSGYTLEDLSAYFDRGRTPRIAAIESDPQCRAILDSMANFAALSRKLVADDSREPVPDAWFDGIMREVVREFRAGRDISLRPSTGGIDLVVTEGALRELVRTVGDGVPGVLVGRVGLEYPDEDGTIDIRLSVSVVFGRRIVDAVSDVRAVVRDAVSRHGRLRAGEIDVIVDDVHLGEDER